MTADVRQMILDALNDAGGSRYLLEQSRANPVAFMALIGKILPMQVTGADGGALIIQQIVAAGNSAYRRQREEEAAAEAEETGPRLH